MLRKNLYVVVATFIIKFEEPVTLQKQIFSSSNVLMLELT